VSEDPKLFDAGDYNLFRYCHNDPIDMTDAMGTDDTAPTYDPRETSHQGRRWSGCGKGGGRFTSPWKLER
jgi:hypothetical protein